MAQTTTKCLLSPEILKCFQATIVRLPQCDGLIVPPTSLSTRSFPLARLRSPFQTLVFPAYWNTGPLYPRQTMLEGVLHSVLRGI